MNVSEMTLEELEAIDISSVEFGRNFAERLQRERIRILDQMAGELDNRTWQKLSDRRYDLHRLRIQVLLAIGLMVAHRKKIAGGK